MSPTPRRTCLFLTFALLTGLVAVGVANPPAVFADAGEGASNGGRQAYAVIASGAAHTCVIVESGPAPGGDVRCWGDNVYGQLGMGDQTARGDQPGELVGIAAANLGGKAVAIAAGSAHNCALMVGGTVKCWGRNSSGQLGDGDVNTRGTNPLHMGANLPAVDLGAGRTAVQIAAGGETSCAILDNGALKCWGLNTSGQLGVGSTANLGDQAGEMGDSLAAVNLGAGMQAVSVSVGVQHVCAVVAGGDGVRSLRCWGENSSGQLGLGDTLDRGDQAGEVASAVPALVGVEKISAVAAGRAHTCAIVDEISVACWGANNAGQLGRATVGANRGDQAGEMAAAIDVSMLEASPLSGVTAGADFTCIQRLTIVKCWGENAAGQLGLDNVTDVGGPSFSLPSAATSKASNAVAAMSAGDASVCFIQTDRRVKCVGNNDSGRLGIGTIDGRGDAAGESAAVPLVAIQTTATASQVVGGQLHSCALVTGGVVKCWGSSTYAGIGVLGNNLGGSAGEIAASPVTDLGPGVTATQLASAWYSTCAVVTNGDMRCWGESVSGQLGVGPADTVGDQPGEMGGNLTVTSIGAPVVQLEAGVSQYCAIVTQGRVKCWGENGSGQLGVGDSSDRGDQAGEMGAFLPFVQLGTGRTAVDLAVGGFHTCAVLDNGSVKCWGVGNRLGLGDTVSRGLAAGQMGDALPTVNLGTGRTATSIVAGADSTCALLDNSTVKCWGQGQYGSLGNGIAGANTVGDAAGEMGDSLAPVALGTGRTATEIWAGDYFFCAHLDNGQVKCWGRNVVGQLGVNDTNDRGDGPGEMGDSLPAVALPGAFTVASAGLGSSHACVVTTVGGVVCWGSNVATGREDTLPVGPSAGSMANAAAVIMGVGVPYLTLTTSPVSDVPSAPQLPTSSFAGGTTATLSWTVPLDDNGAAITGYRIERATSATGPWSAEIADTGSAATTAAVSNLTLGSPTYLRVRAINAVGAGAPAALATPLAGTRPFLPLTPFRLADTRSNGVTGDGQGAATGLLAAGSTLTVQVGGRGNVPATAKAAVLNLTAVSPQGKGYATIYPCDTAQPLASNLNYVAGRTIANASVVRLSATGSVCVFVQSATHLLVDVNGAYAVDSDFQPVTPMRFMDTRADGETIDGQSEKEGPIPAGTARYMDVGGRSGVPADAKAAVLNVTVTQPAAKGFVTVYPCSGSNLTPPSTSSLNFAAGQTVANGVITATAGSGNNGICVYASATTHVVVDVLGYHPAFTGLRSQTPSRLADTRSAGTTGDGQGAATGAVGAGQTLTVQVRGRSGVTTTAAAAVLNVTLTQTAGSGFATVYPCDESRPTASNLNFVAGQTVPNLVVAKLSATGTVCIYSSAATHMIVDLGGVEAK